jgi:LAO/AO transport system kinase
MVQHYPKQSWWQVPVLATQAVNNVGIEELFKQIEKHRHALEGSGQLEQRRREQRRREFMETVERRVSAELLQLVEQNEDMGKYMDRVEAGEIDPYSAADEITRPKAFLAGLSQKLSERRSGE